MLEVRALGPIGAERDAVPLDLGTPRQRAVFARLLTQRGGAVSADRLIEELWRGYPPPKASASLQAYVSNLRRILEPQRPARGAARILVSTPTGYALRLPEQAVDAWRFEAAVRRARDAGAAGTALESLREALGWWRGPAYGEFGQESWAAVEVTRLTELHTTARELAIEAALRSGGVGEAVPAAEVFVHEFPLRGEGWRLLALGLWASERQADALAALRRAGALSRRELGLGLAPALDALQQAILNQRLEILRAAVPEAGRDQAVVLADTPVAVPIALAANRPDAASGAAAGLFIGREAELLALTRAADAAREGGGVALVTGAAGAGKSALLHRLRDQLRAAGWTTVLGRCPESDGAPPAWAWVEALGELAATHPPEDPEPLAALLRESAAESALGEEPAAGDAALGRFRLHRAVGAWLRRAAAAAPLAVFIDDLHRADGQTTALLERAADLPGAPVLLVGAYRPVEADGPLTKTLAELARRTPCRADLSGLPRDEVAELVRTVCGGDVDAETIAVLTERTGGNPFYVRESARLLADEGALVALSEVPQGVRDVLRRRLRRLAPGTVAVLRLAAVVGLETDVDVLLDAAAADASAQECEVLDSLEAAVLADLLTEPVPGRVRFVHALVRDTLYTDLPGVRRARLHLRLAETLRRLRPQDPSALAYHYAKSASAASAPLAVEYALRAAELAERRYAHDASVELLEQAVESARLIPAAPLEHAAQLVDLLGRLQRAQIRAGAMMAARQTRARAIEVAQGVADDDLLAAAFAAWSEPTPWLLRPTGRVDQGVLDILDRLTARTDLDPVTLARLLQASVDERKGTDDPEMLSAARRQLAIARAQGDPLLLASALDSMTKPLPHEFQADRREEVVTELRELARAQDLPAYQWICEHVSCMIAGARNDVEALERHAQAGLALALRYRMAEPAAISRCALAALALAAGRFEQADALYTAVREQLGRHGAWYGANLHILGQLIVAMNQGRNAQIEPLAWQIYETLQRDTGLALAVVLARQGKHDEARAIRHFPEPKRDNLYGLSLSLRAELACLLGDRAKAPALIELLLPLRDQVAGAASGTSFEQPFAYRLGELYLLLGEREQARREFSHAENVALRWKSDYLARRARAAAAAAAAPTDRSPNAPAATHTTRPYSSSNVPSPRSAASLAAPANVGSATSG